MEELPLTLRLIVLGFLLGVNGFFSAAEVALVSVRGTRMRALAAAGDRHANIVLEFLNDPDRMISATQLGVTLASLGLGWAGESTVYRLIEPLTRPWITPATEQIGHVFSFTVAFSAITFLHMVVGEVVPKNLGMERAERLSLAVAKPLRLFARVTGLFVSLVEGTSERISRLMGLKLNAAEQAYTAEELKLLFSVSKREGRLAQFQEAMLSRAVDFHDVTLREVMVPRQEMVALPSTATFGQVVDYVVRYQHSRIPVYEGSSENVIGVLFVKEMWSFVQQMHRWQAQGRPPPPFRLQAFLHHVPFAPETKFLYELLEEFQQQRYHMAVVVDEFGTVIGLVTVEDALEQIVGEIREEHERPKPGELQPADDPAEIDGITNVRDLASLYRIELPYDTGFETLAGFLLSRLGHIPRESEEIEFEGRKYIVVEMEHNRIATVRVERLAAAPRLAGSPEAQQAENG